MTGKPRFPRLDIEVTEDVWETAVEASSGSCLIADSIKAQFPQFTGVTVDAQTIRISDKNAGQRYTYLTPAAARDLLTYFDQGWDEPSEHVFRLRSPIKVDKLTRAPVTAKAREARKAELQAKLDRGEQLTRRENQSLAKMAATDARQSEPLPSTTGPIAEVIPRREGNATVVGGKPLPQPKGNPNLLAGRNRIFGAKTAKPARAFAQAVEQAVAARLAEAGAGGGAIQTS
jgi:hypothetical protein